MHRLANPDYHLLSPVEKWKKRVIGDKQASPGEMRQLYLHYVRKDLDRIAQNEGTPKRELNELMTRYLILRRH